MNSRKCEWCGKPFFPTAKAQRFCCSECSGKQSEYNRRKASLESKSLEQIAIEANERGLSYGEYMRIAAADLQAWKKKRGGQK